MSDLVRIKPTPATVAVADRDIPVLEIALGGIPRGLVVYLCETGGFESEAVEVMNHVAQDGYESLAAEVSELGGADARAGLTEALFDRAAGRGWDREQIALVGIGVGGRAVLDAAARLEFAAAVSISPTPEGRASSSKLSVHRVQTPWLGMYGELDPHANEYAELEAELWRGNDVFTRVVVYPGVARDFHRQVGDGISYAASYDSWQRTVEWLNARVSPRLTPLAVAWRQRSAAA